MALTAVSLVLFAGIVASWVRLPGSMTEETHTAPVATPEIAPQLS